MKQFKNILCAVDPETTMDTAIMQSLRMANEHQAEITFISVVKDAKNWLSLFRDDEQWNYSLQAYLEDKRADIEEKLRSIAPQINADIVVTSGISFIEIIKQVIRNQHDLLIKCAQDQDWMDRMLGSDDMHLLRKCPCPLLMLKPGFNEGFQRVLATVDVNENLNELDGENVQEKLNEKVLEYSAALSLADLAEMHIGSAWEAYGEDFYRYGAFSRIPDDEVDQYAEKARRSCFNKIDFLVEKMEKLLGKDAFQYLQPRAHLVKGQASIEIPALVEKYDVSLVVMGTVGRVGVPGLIIGNTAESILEQTECCILAIKPEGFKTPVE